MGKSIVARRRRQLGGPRRRKASATASPERRATSRSHSCAGHVSKNFFSKKNLARKTHFKIDRRDPFLGVRIRSDETCGGGAAGEKRAHARHCAVDVHHAHPVAHVRKPSSPRCKTRNQKEALAVFHVQLPQLDRAQLVLLPLPHPQLVELALLQVWRRLCHGGGAMVGRPFKTLSSQRFSGRVHATGRDMMGADNARTRPCTTSMCQHAASEIPVRCLQKKVPSVLRAACVV